MSKNETAAEAYDRNLETFNDLITKLSEYINGNDGHADCFRAEGETNWGYVGDLGHVNELLTRALPENG